MTDAAHGTRSRYVHDGCRCEPCTRANRVYQGARIAKPTRARLLGVDDAEYARLLDLQDGHCALCLAKPKKKRLAADHDHKNERVRGLLCHRCNRALPSWITRAWLWKAILYLDDETLDAGALVLYGREGKP